MKVIKNALTHPFVQALAQDYLFPSRGPNLREIL